MKSMRLVAVLLVLLCGGASANLLLNPGFENGTNYWSVDGWYIGSGGDAHRGLYGVANHVPEGRPSGDYYIASQIVPVTAGLSYDASVWMRYAGTANNSEQFMEIQWVDNLGQIMWGNGVGTTPVSGPQDYSHFNLAGLIAPIGAVEASVRAVVHTTEATTDNAWHTFDDFSFAQTIPEPTTLALLGMAVGVLGLVRRRKV